MKIQIKIKHVELSYQGADVEGYPRIVTTDKWKGDKNKSERLMEVIREMTAEAIRSFNETKTTDRYKRSGGLEAENFN